MRQAASSRGRRRRGVPIVVAQPNGPQQRPDIVIIHGKNIAYIEHKTNKGDHIVWNGGMPRRNGIYLFNSGIKGTAKQTTIFLGQHALSDADRNLLEQAADAAAKAAEPFNAILKTNGSRWTCYARAMFNRTGRDRCVRHPDVARREEESTAFLIEHLNRPHA
jgi:enamine deaminase RidA (YjgF/YER057c/UK114 family)